MADPEEVADEQAAELEDPIVVDLDVDRARSFDQFGFSRMRTEWGGRERGMLERIRSMVDGVILQHFSPAYAIMSDIYDVVREPEMIPGTEEVRRDANGFPVWARSPTGAFYEDWSRLGIRQREDFLYRITTSLFQWSQVAADFWGEAMFAKAQWTEKFAYEYGQPIEKKQDRIEDRTAVANVRSAEDRYFAIYLSLLSRKADAIVKSMELLGQRLKDGMG